MSGGFLDQGAETSKVILDKVYQENRGSKPRETQREQPYRLNDTNNTSTMHTFFMARTYPRSGLSACSVLLCLLLLFLRQLCKNFD